MANKNIRMKALAEKAGMSYTYYTRIMKGEREVSAIYATKLITFAQASGIDLTRAKNYTIDIPDANVVSDLRQEYKPPAPKELFTETGMRPGTEFEITTKVTMKNDMITGYNVDLKRIS
jgi:transcriptional regulator with XRE-family HTH domain